MATQAEAGEGYAVIARANAELEKFHLARAGR
jgi:hypothetical protein